MKTLVAGAVATIADRTAARPKVAIVLGSGLGGFADELSERVEIPYSQIHGWPVSTAVGHAGKLIVGCLESTPVAVGTLANFLSACIAGMLL